MRRASDATRMMKGLGQGVGSSYQPWLRPWDVASRGRTSRIPGLKTGREHIVFSDGEQRLFVIDQWNPTVTDIREQFPLPLEETLEIARELGVAHPAWHGKPIVMTTDFLVTFVRSKQTMYAVRQVKTRAHLEHRRVIEKLEIDRVYWDRQKIEWGIVTHEDVNCPLATNILWVNECWDFPDPSLTANQIAKLETCLFERLLESGNQSLREACIDSDDKLGFQKGTCLSLVRHAIAHRHWLVQMDVELDVRNPVPDIRLPANAEATKRSS